ncbi:hypothetical protein SEA_WATERMOORE_26 [Streptomyces phage Watermoore]|uniref:Uncharacterized protein n=1 Tax=Streptomyces phage Cross TaxID=2805844 RepID=A0A890UQY3_9CAUD|nr:hypothetical protein SEA_CROSS_26 [Streptomyces phage Cross]WNN95388.1 hypothetical protein SEA_WATERMOORE_26 [Streptomyces phage Watermoore]
MANISAAREDIVAVTSVDSEIFIIVRKRAMRGRASATNVSYIGKDE